MRPFAPSMYPHRCFVLPLAESGDPAAATVEGFPPTSGLTAVPCRVRLKETLTGFAGDGETGRTTADVSFPSNPGVAKGWRLQRQSDGLSLRCLGSAKDRAGGFNFVVPCEVIE